jgi:hypothetical protein
LKEQRKLVVERALALDQEGILKVHRYWKEVEAYHEEAERATTSSSTVQALAQALREPKEPKEIYRVFVRPVANNWTPQTTPRKKKHTKTDVRFDFPSEPYLVLEPSNIV